MLNECSISDRYLAEFHEHHNLSNLNPRFNPIRNLIQYNFGVELKYLTPENICNQENFIKIIQEHSKFPSDLEKDTDNELEECLNSFSK